MIIVGLSGKKQVGKDVVCERIRRRFGTSARVAFADALKDDVCKMMKITREELESNKPLYRGLLQWYGTDYCRKKFGENYWIERWLKRALLLEVEIIIVPDVRFPNEVRAVHDCKGFVFRVNRPSLMSVDTHESETALDNYTKFNRTIMNVGSIQQLHTEVDVAMEMTGLL